jgi:PadR family transcriptional regulator PadR
MADKFISRPEEIMLLAVWKLKDNAYGMTIREFIQKRTGKYWSIGAVYVPLERLEKKGLLTSYNSTPSPERGGRRKRLFKITASGIKELNELYRMNSVLWKGYPKLSPDENK